MNPIEQRDMPFAGRRIRNPRFRRGIFLLPSLFTGANLLCGYYAVIASIAGGSEDFNHAARAIGLAILFDSLDGRVARMTGTNTEFGVQFDSLADVVSFEEFCGYAYTSGGGSARCARAWIQISLARLAVVGDVVCTGRDPGRADDQHDSLLQFQRYSMDA
jgi:phosphatidylglycerophosphate synthase